MAESLPVVNIDDDETSPLVSPADKLRLAASKGLLDKVTELLQSGASFEPDKEGRTAIHYAAVHGYTDICKLLIDYGCDVDSRDNLGYTPLHRAAAQGHIETVKLIVDEGCAIDRQDEVHGNTALHEAAWNGFSHTISLLIKNKINVFVTNKAGFTALHLTAQNGHNESARVLLYSGCSSDLKNNYGDTALHTASRYGHAGVIRILVSAQCSISEQNKNGDTALHIAAALKRRKISKILMESGIDANSKNKQNETATDVARRKEHPEVIIIISKTQPKLAKRHPKAAEGRARGHHRPTPPSGKEPGKEKKGLFPWMRKKDKDKKLFSPDSDSPQENGAHGPPGQQRHHGKHGKEQGMFGQYVKKQGMQYYRDLAGNIKQGPVGYTSSCQCQPQLKKLEQQVEADRHNFYDHVDASHQQLTQKIDNLERRTTQQIYSIDRLGQERLEAERHDCQERIERRTMQERLETDRELEIAQARVQDELHKWMQIKGGQAPQGKREETFGANPSKFDRDVFENNSFRRKKGNRRYAWAGRLMRSRSDETLSHSEYSFHGKAYQSRKNAIDQLRSLKLSTVNEGGVVDRSQIVRPNPVGQLTRPRTMYEELARREPLRALSEQSADSKSTPDMSGNFSQRRHPIDVRLLREFEDSELESRARPHDSSKVTKSDTDSPIPKQVDVLTPIPRQQLPITSSFKQITVPPTFTSTPAHPPDGAASRAQPLPPQKFLQPPPYNYNSGPPKPSYSSAWSMVRKPAIAQTPSNGSSNYAELSGLQSTSPSYMGSSATQSPPYSGADSPGQKTESGSNPDSGYSSKMYGVRQGYTPGHVPSPLLDSPLNSSNNDSTNAPSYQNSPNASYELIQLHSSINNSTLSTNASNYANVSSDERRHNVGSTDISKAVNSRDYANIPDSRANISGDSIRAVPNSRNDYANVLRESSRQFGNYANVHAEQPLASRSVGDYANISGDRLTASRQYNHPTQEIEQWYQRHKPAVDTPPKSREITTQGAEAQPRVREVAQPAQGQDSTHRYRELSQPPQQQDSRRYREVPQKPPGGDSAPRYREVALPPQPSTGQRRYRPPINRSEPRVSHSTDV